MQEREQKRDEKERLRDDSPRMVTVERTHRERRRKSQRKYRGVRGRKRRTEGRRCKARK
jgi:hypothetical protein